MFFNMWQLRLQSFLKCDRADVLSQLSEFYVLFRPEPDVLQIELLPANAPGDRSIYVENDGRVRIF